MKTKRGVLALLIYHVISAAYSFLGVALLSGGGSPAFTIVVGITIFIALLALLIIGVRSMWSGRDEFGPRHRTFATIGCWLIPISIILAIVGGGVGFAMAFTGSTAGAIGGISMLVLAAILGALAYILLVYHLVGVLGKLLLLAGLFITIGLLVLVFVSGQSTLYNILYLAYVISLILAYIIAFVKVSGMTPVSAEKEVPEWQPEPIKSPAQG